MTDYDDEDPLASWEAALLPDWEWEAYETEDDGLYYGRVKSPHTYDRWEYGYFSQEQLEKAGAYRTDLDPDDDEPLYPDGGCRSVDELVETRYFETELEIFDDAFEASDDDHGGET